MLKIMDLHKWSQLDNIQNYYLSTFSPLSLAYNSLSIQGSLQVHYHYGILSHCSLLRSFLSYNNFKLN